MLKKLNVSEFKKYISENRFSKYIFHSDNQQKKYKSPDIMVSFHTQPRVFMNPNFISIMENPNYVNITNVKAVLIDEKDEWWWTTITFKCRGRFICSRKYTLLAFK